MSLAVASVGGGYRIAGSRPVAGAVAALLTGIAGLHLALVGAAQWSSDKYYYFGATCA